GPMFGRYGRRSAKQWLDLIEKTHAERELMVDDGLTVDVLRGFRFPLLAVYGERSMARPPGDPVRGGVPPAEHRLIPGAGHFFPATRVTELTAACEQFWSDRIVPSSRPSVPRTRRPVLAQEGDAGPVSG